MKMESSIFTSITNTRPKLTCFMFKMFKAFIPTKPMATPQELVLPRVGTIFQSSSETPFKFSRFTVGLSHLEKLSFAQASAYIASANAKNIQRAKNHIKISEAQQIIYQ